MNDQTKTANTFLCTTCGNEFSLREALNNYKAKTCRKCVQEKEHARWEKAKAERQKRLDKKDPAQIKKARNERDRARREAANLQRLETFLREGKFSPKDITLLNILVRVKDDPEFKPELRELYYANKAAYEEKMNATAKRMSVAEKELLKRELMRRKLLPFIKKFNRGYDAGWVHEDICERLERFVKAVEDKQAPRLMLFMPPRHGKSEIASKNFPSWVLGKHPEWEIIASSYAVSLPIGFSRKVQANIADDYYQKLFPQTKLHPKAQSAEAWMTTKEGGYVAAGVGGGITGKGAHIFIIDDPVKDAEEADSDTQREKVWDWWGSTAKTRLAPGGGVLVIQTRWHDDDLSGRMIKQMHDALEEFDELIMQAKARRREFRKFSKEWTEADDEVRKYEEERAEIDTWEIVSYPAIATKDEFLLDDGSIVHELQPGAKLLRRDGEALHESRYPLSRLRNMKRSMQPRHWSALYQQNPVPDEGVYFTKEMLRFTNSIPPIKEMKLYSAWDLAVGEKQHNDFTVGVVGAMDWQGQIHIIDMVHMRGDTHKVADAILATYKKYPSILQIGIEKGQLELAIMPQLNKLMREAKLYPTFNHELRPITDKWVRARPLQGRMQHGTVVFPTNQPWVDIAVAELLRFPGGLHDDIVDALAWLIRMMQDVTEPPKPGTGLGQNSWKKRLNKIIAGQQGNRGYMGS